jgi:hypothetical protein
MTAQKSKQEMEEAKAMRRAMKEYSNTYSEVFSKDMERMFRFAFLKGENYGIIRLADELEIGGKKNEK